MNIARDAEHARLKQQEEIAVQRAQQKADVVKEEMDRFRESEASRITAQEDVKKMEIAQLQTIEQTRIENEEKVKTREIKKRKQLELEEKQREITVTEKSMEVLQKRAEEELVRAKAVGAEEKVQSTRELEVAERVKRIELVRATQQSEREAIQLTTIAKAERKAAEERESADKHASLSAKFRYEVDAAGKQMLNEAENVRSDESRRSALRMTLAGKLDSIIRESVKPMQNIDAIKILEVNGLPGFSGGAQLAGGDGGGSIGSGGTGGGSGNGGGSPQGNGGGNLADSVVNSALRYRAQMPFVDNLLHEIGMSPGEISNLSNIFGSFDKEVVDATAQGTASPSTGKTKGAGPK